MKGATLQKHQHQYRSSFCHLPKPRAATLMMFFNGVSPQRIFILKLLLAIEAEIVIQALPVVQMEVGFRFEDLLRECRQMPSNERSGDSEGY